MIKFIMNSISEKQTKNCKVCNKVFEKRSTCSKANWEKSSYCSRECSKKCNVGRECPWKGKKMQWDTWNKGKKGLQVAWNKGMKFEINERHSLWKGDDASLVAKHAWVKRRLGFPKKCEKCGTTEDRMYHWANISNEYKRSLDDWIRLCVPCHKNFDLEKIKNKQTHE